MKNISMILVVGLIATIGCNDPQALGVQTKSNQQKASSPSGESAGKQKEEKNMNLETATFAGGCFWCVEAVFLQIDGVESVMPGYMGGHVEIRPTNRFARRRLDTLKSFRSSSTQRKFRLTNYFMFSSKRMILQR